MTGTRTTVRHPPTHHRMRARRLVLERIEQRVLLSASSPAGMEHLHAVFDTGGDCVIIGRDPTGAGYGSSGAHLPDIVTSPNGSGHSTGPNVNRIMDCNLPSVNQDPTVIDVGPVVENSVVGNSLCAVQEAAISEIRPPAALKSNSARAGVDGASGRCQVFELATANDSSSSPDARQFSEGPAKPVSAGSVLRATQADSALQKSPSPRNDSPMQADGTSQWRGVYDNHADGGPATVRNTDVSPTLAGKEVRRQGVEIHGEQRHTGASHRLPIKTAVAVLQSKTAVAVLPLSAASTRSTPAQSVDPAERSRQAVFAEMTKDAEEPCSVSPSLLEERRTTLVGLAIASIAVPRLTQRWWRPVDPSRTCLLPPRRRDTAG